MTQSSVLPVTATVVICTRNRPEQLEGCLAAVSLQDYPQFDVIVVENGEPDGRTRSTAEAHGARYLSVPRTGLSIARNAGALACSSEVIAYLDDDARPERDWLTSLLREYTAPDISVVTGKVEPMGNGGEWLQRHVKANRYGDLRPRRTEVGPQTPEWFSITNFGGVGDGCNMSLRRSAFDVWNGFDERLGRGALLNSAEEHFAFFEIVRLGYRCVYTPFAIVHHPCPDTAEDVRRHHFMNIANAVAYSAMLWWEHPQIRPLLYRHFTRRAQRRRVPESTASASEPILSRREKITAVLSGLRIFWMLPRRGASQCRKSL